MASYFLHRPSFPLKVGIPLSCEMPAPVTKTIFSALYNLSAIDSNITLYQSLIDPLLLLRNHVWFVPLLPKSRHHRILQKSVSGSNLIQMPFLPILLLLLQWNGNFLLPFLLAHLNTWNQM